MNRYDDGWTEFLLSELKDNEKDENGHPKVNGLRRLVEKHIGKIVADNSHVVKAPTLGNDFIAVVSNTISIVPHDSKEKNEDRYLYTEVADVSVTNANPEFSRFPTAFASTRARGRNLRNILGLDTVCNEETTELPVGFSGEENKNKNIDVQIVLIKKLCDKLGIDVDALARQGEAGKRVSKIAKGKNFDYLKEYYEEEAIGVINFLNGLQADEVKLKEYLDKNPGVKKNV